jgi:hypothetical protein
MGVEPAREVILSDLECEVFEALMAACRLTDRAAAERLFNVWIKMPSQRASQLGFQETDE